jgi:hypothetical protein
VLVSVLEQVDRRTEAPRGGRYEAHMTKRDRLKVRIACLAGRVQRHAVVGACGAWIVQVEERQAAGEQGNLAVVAEDLLPLRAGGCGAGQLVHQLEVRGDWDHQLGWRGRVVHVLIAQRQRVDDVRARRLEHERWLGYRRGDDTRVSQQLQQGSGRGRTEQLDDGPPVHDQSSPRLKDLGEQPLPERAEHGQVGPLLQQPLPHPQGHKRRFGGSSRNVGHHRRRWPPLSPFARPCRPTAACAPVDEGSERDTQDR